MGRRNLEENGSGAGRKNVNVQELLRFDPERHEYSLDGRVIPSVTTILEGVRAYSTRWFTEESSTRGTTVHEYTAWIEKGMVSFGDFEGNPYAGWIEAFRKFLADSQWRSEEIEFRMVHSSLLFAGTTDRIGRPESSDFRKKYRIRENERVVLDIKTGPFAAWHVVQLEAYRMMAKEAKPFDGHTRIFGLYLRENGRDTFRDCPGNYQELWMLQVRNYHGGGVKR